MYDAPCIPDSPLVLLYCYLITLLLSSQYLLQLLLSLSLVFTHRVVQPIACCHLVPLSSCYLAIIISKQVLVSVKWFNLSVCYKAGCVACSPWMQLALNTNALTKRETGLLCMMHPASLPVLPPEGSYPIRYVYVHTCPCMLMKDEE